MTDEQFIEVIYHLDRIAAAVEVLAVASDPKYDGLRAAGNRRAEAKRELNAKRQKPKAPPQAERL